MQVRLNPVLWTLDVHEAESKTFTHAEDTEVSKTAWDRLSSHRSDQGGISHQTLVAEGEEPAEPIFLAQPVESPPEGEEGES